jgi:hypothetical protein
VIFRINRQAAALVIEMVDAKLAEMREEHGTEKPWPELAMKQASGLKVLRDFLSQ